MDKQKILEILGKFPQDDVDKEEWFRVRDSLLNEIPDSEVREAIGFLSPMIHRGSGSEVNEPRGAHALWQGLLEKKTSSKELE